MPEGGVGTEEVVEIGVSGCRQEVGGRDTEGNTQTPWEERKAE